MEIEAGFNFDVAARQFLFGAPVKTGDGRGGPVERNLGRGHFWSQDMQGLLWQRDLRGAHPEGAFSQRPDGAGHLIPEVAVVNLKGFSFHRAVKSLAASFFGSSTIMAPGLFICPATSAALSPQPQ